MRYLTDLCYLLAGAAISPVVLYRILKHKRYRIGWAHRFGKITRRNPDKKCIWLHAVSVGEVNAAQTIVNDLRNRFDDPRSESRTSFEIVISSTTDTGFARANALFGKDFEVFYFPLDLSCIISKAFAQITPTICLLMELEVWPNFVWTAHKLNVPVVVVNGRISDKSFSQYKKIKPLAKRFFRKVTLVLAQTDEYARRFIELGCLTNRVIVTGSLKYDTAQITDKVEGADALAAKLSLGKEKLWVAGGTGNNEEKILLDVYKQLKQQDEFSDLRLAIVPRKPERFDEVAELIKQTGFELIRYSSVKAEDRRQKTENRKQRTEGRERNSSFDNRQSNLERRVTSDSSFAVAPDLLGPLRRMDESPVILGDTMGDLRKFYSLATIIFVGRSLVPMGGSDMMEAAALGKCTIFGPHAFNFKQTVDALLADEGAIMVKDSNDLLRVMQKCLRELDFAARIAKNGQKVIRKNQGATAKSIEQIAKFL